MNDRPYRVMIDPGHGGSDIGAMSKGLDLIREKDITLSVAKIMRNIVFRGDFLFDTYTTRRRDEFISLQARCEKAKSWGAHAFLSIHCNARYARGKEGIEIEVFHNPGSKAGREYANLTLGCLLCEVMKKTKAISRGVKTKGFYVLRNTHCPAILAELGFLTDPEEAKFLADRRNQRTFAYALSEATELFLEGGFI